MCRALGHHLSGFTVAAAQMVGYESEAAFSRAFKRIFQLGPGEFRRGA